MIRLNVGCGLDVRDGWVNVDLGSWDYDPEGPDADLGPRLVLPPGVLYADAAEDLGEWHGRCETVLLNHVLHMLPYDQADVALDQCARCLAPGGELVIVEADVLGVIGGPRANWPVAELVADDVEPTVQGKLLRWAVWHGTRRSLWSVESLIERLTRRGLEADETEAIWGREAESFAVFGARPE
jgi:SAM-dependent methyltransferase